MAKCHTGTIVSKRVFIAEYVKNIRQVGAVLPSSRYLVRKMCHAVDFATAKSIVEYGPGTGVLTREIVRRMQPDAKLLLIEANPQFCHALRREFAAHKQVKIVCDGAQNITTILRKHHYGTPDIVFCGLPFAALSSEMSHSILQQTAELIGSHGVFVAFQYTLMKKQMIGQYFSHTKLDYEVRNVPPAYVLRCSNEL